MRKTLLVLTILTFIMGVSLGVGPGFVPKADAAELIKLKISASNWVGYGTLWLAKALGYYEDEGLDVEMVRMESKIAQFSSLASNRIQGLCTVGSTFLAYYKSEYPIKLVLGLGGARVGETGGDGALTSSDVKSWKDFKGKTIAVSFYCDPHIIVYYMLEKAGLDPKKDVSWVDMTAADAASAFAAKKVDIALTWEPHLTKGLQTRSDAKLFWNTGSEESPPISGDYLAFNADFISKNRDQAVGVVRAIMRAEAYAEANEKKACEIMAREMGGWLKDPVLFQELFYKAAQRNLELAYLTMTQGLTRAEWKAQGKKGQPAESSFEIMLFYGKYLMKLGKLKEFPPIEQIIDSSIIRQVKKEGLK